MEAELLPEEGVARRWTPAWISAETGAELFHHRKSPNIQKEFSFKTGGKTDDLVTVVKVTCDAKSFNLTRSLSTFYLIKSV